MKENKYDDAVFFKKYSELERSKKGLKGAGEWETLQKLLPDFCGKNVLDLGCGYGWHCIYAIQNNAKSAVGVDISEKMIAIAKEKMPDPKITYICKAIEDADFEPQSFDIVISSLAFHYVEVFEDVLKKVNKFLVSGGYFVFSTEHPIFTSCGKQDWYYDENGEIMHFPVDDYFFEGSRDSIFLGEKVVKYHKTISTYLNGLLEHGFEILNINEPMPSKDMLKIAGMKHEMRRPSMLIVKARKKD